MTAKKHLVLFLQASLVWAAFWLAGLPYYFQQYSQLFLATGSILLSVLISLAAIFVLLHARVETRMSRAFWLSLYYTLPFAVYDTLYCGVYLGHGADYLYSYWYLTIFYITPWLTFMPTAYLLGTRKQ
ncbi:MAG: hypothetical protein ACREO1_01525 [Arenimonas sp.]